MDGEVETHRPPTRRQGHTGALRGPGSVGGGGQHGEPSLGSGKEERESRASRLRPGQAEWSRGSGLSVVRSIRAHGGSGRRGLWKSASCKGTTTGKPLTVRRNRPAREEPPLPSQRDPDTKASEHGELTARRRPALCPRAARSPSELLPEEWKCDVFILRDTSAPPVSSTPFSRAGKP